MKVTLASVLLFSALSFGQSSCPKGSVSFSQVDFSIDTLILDAINEMSVAQDIFFVLKKDLFYDNSLDSDVEQLVFKTNENFCLGDECNELEDDKAMLIRVLHGLAITASVSPSRKKEFHNQDMILLDLEPGTIIPIASISVKAPQWERISDRVIFKLKGSHINELKFSMREDLSIIDYLSGGLLSRDEDISPFIELCSKITSYERGTTY